MMPIASCHSPHSKKCEQFSIYMTLPTNAKIQKSNSKKPNQATTSAAVHLYCFDFSIFYFPTASIEHQNGWISSVSRIPLIVLIKYVLKLFNNKLNANNEQRLHIVLNHKYAYSSLSQRLHIPHPKKYQKT